MHLWSQFSSSVISQLALASVRSAAFPADENCYRGYLSFAPDTREVLDAWNIGTQGSDTLKLGDNSLIRSVGCGRASKLSQRLLLPETDQ